MQMPAAVFMRPSIPAPPLRSHMLQTLRGLVLRRLLKFGIRQPAIFNSTPLAFAVQSDCAWLAFPAVSSKARLYPCAYSTHPGFFTCPFPYRTVTRVIRVWCTDARSRAMLSFLLCHHTSAPFQQGCGMIGRRGASGPTHVAVRYPIAHGRLFLRVFMRNSYYLYLQCAHI